MSNDASYNVVFNVCPYLDVAVGAATLYNSSSIADIKSALTVSSINAGGVASTVAAANYSLTTDTDGTALTSLDVGENDIYVKYGSVYKAVKLTAAEDRITSVKEIKTAPTKTTYTAYETFDPSGLVITVNYASGKTGDIAYSNANDTEFSFTPALTEKLKVADTKVTITYTKNYTNPTATGTGSKEQAITVNAKKITPPQATGTYTYSGQAQDFTYTNAQDAAFYTIGEPKKGTDADTYTADVELKDTTNTTWTDGTNTKKQLQWTIGKANQTITASEEITVTYGDTNKYLTAAAMGEITYVVSNDTADIVSIAADGKITTLKAGTATVTVKAAATKNYNAATDKTVTVKVDKKTVTPSINAIPNQSFTNGVIQPTIGVTCSGGTLILNTDYTIEYDTATQYVGTDTGTVKIHPVADSNYTFTDNVTKKFSVVASSAPGSVTTTGKVAKERSVDLDSYVSGATYGYSIAQATGSGTFVSETNVYTAPNATGTATFTVSVSAKDMGGSTDNDYSAWQKTITLDIVDLIPVDATTTVSNKDKVEFTYGNTNGVTLNATQPAKDDDQKTIASNGEWTWTIADDTVLEKGAPGLNSGVSSVKITGKKAGFSKVTATYITDEHIATIDFVVYVNQKDIELQTITAGTSGSKEYDGSCNVSVTTGGIKSGELVGGDNVSLVSTTVTGTTATKNVGNNKTVTYAFALTGAQKDNYKIKSQTVTVNVTVRKVKITGIVADGKIYDGNTSAKVSFANAEIVYNVGSDAVTENVTLDTSGASANFDTKAAGGSASSKTKTVTVSGLNLSGTDSSNYEIAAAPAVLSYILKKDVEVYDVVVKTKTYDAATSAEVTSAKIEAYIISGDTVTLNLGSGTFDNKNVGTNKDVKLSGFSLAGEDANNYKLNTASHAKGSITAKAITVKNPVAGDKGKKEVDGTTNVTVTAEGLNDVCNGDTVSLVSNTVTGTTADGNIGTGKPVTVAFALTGTDAGNYTLTQPTNVKVDITKKAVYIRGLKANHKTFDNTTAAQITGTPSLEYKIGSDTYGKYDLTLVKIELNTTNAKATFADKNVANGIKVTFSGYALGGNDAGNYDLRQPDDVTANITKADATGKITGSSGNYKWNTTSISTGSCVVTVPSNAKNTNNNAYAKGELPSKYNSYVTTWDVDVNGKLTATVSFKEQDAIDNLYIPFPVVVTTDNYKTITVDYVAYVIAKDTQATLTISNLTNNGSVTYGTDITLSTSGGSGSGSVSYVITDGDGTVASLSGSTLKLLKAGTFKIKAIKAEDTDYSETESAIYTVTVDPLCTLQQGGVVKYTAASAKADGSYSFGSQSLADGEYNLIFDLGNKNAIEQITVANGSIVDGTTVTIPAKATKVNISVSSGEGADKLPAIAVDGMDQLVAQLAADQGNEVPVLVNMEVKTVDTSGTDAALIRQVDGFSGKEVTLFAIDLSYKIGRSSEQDLTDTSPAILTVCVPFDTVNNDEFVIARVHNGTAEALTELKEGDQIKDGTYKLGDNYIYIYASGFCTFGVGYEEIAENISYNPIIPITSSHGTLTVSANAAQFGDVVVVTAKPEAGYHLDTLTVTDADGKVQYLTKRDENTYLFTMPNSLVRVVASFAPDGTAISVFSDVSTAAYYYNPVLWASQNGITSGLTATTFGPDAPCTRAQVVTFLWRAAGCPIVKGTSFVDVKVGSYYENAVAWAVSVGITKGLTATTFGPNAVCTRAQIVTFLSRFAQSSSYGYACPFTDVPANAYYANAVMWALQNNITTGLTATTFGPNAVCTRAQVVTFLYRYFVK